MNKKERHSIILELIENHPVGTQEELVSLLQKEGYMATQATVSRDIRELGLLKADHGDGVRYVQMNGNNRNARRYEGILKEEVQSVDYASSMLVIKTGSGMAMAVAAAIDSMQMEEIVGSIAGDDTIFLALHSAEDAKAVKEAIWQILC
ncbi:MAG: arginine repressor [Lachnospiraceae bacterium]|nr:arginine repressor [Lachnospiraceae bacterium]MBQ5375813.1 arginine repressor [Lachnospiraceae bacterium]